MSDLACIAFFSATVAPFVAADKGVPFSVIVVGIVGAVIFATALWCMRQGIRRDQRNLTDPADWEHATQQRFLDDVRERGGRR